MHFNELVWEELIQFSRQYPLKINELEKNYQIKKLDLHKFQPSEIRAKWLELKQKRDKEVQNISKNWLQNEYKLFVWFIFTYSNFTNQTPKQFSQSFWEQIGSLFRKDSKLCEYFFFCSIKSKTQAWTFEEDQLVEKAMKQENLEKKWTQIGLFMYVESNGIYVRKAKAIRERWLSHLNPSIKKSDWTNEEDIQFFSLVLYHGKKWSKISKIVGNRSEHTIKNRYNKVLKKAMNKKQYQDEGSIQQEIIYQYVADLRKKTHRATKKKQNMIKTNEPCQIKEFQTSMEYGQTEKEIENIKSQKILSFDNKNFSNLAFQPIILTFNGFSM